METLLPMWAEVEMDDALELLGPGEGFRERRVRAYAVGLLGKADDEVCVLTFLDEEGEANETRFATQELMLYLLQLVQALKFETPTSPSPSSSIRHSRHLTRLTTPTSSTVVDSALPTLAEFLIERSARNPVLGNHFHWYIQVECEDKMRGKMFEEVAKRFEMRVKEVSLPNWVFCFSVPWLDRLPSP